MSESRPEARLAAVDGLRAIAMTMVIAQHCQLMPFGWMGVWLFYAISGYVVMRSLDRDADERWPLRVRRFLWRRAGRIVPVYAIYVALAFTTALALGQTVSWPSLPYLLTFTFNWHMALSASPVTAATGHLWTLSVEQQFYLLFPLLLLLPRRRMVIATAILVAAGPLIRLALAAALDLGARFPADAAFAIYASSIGQLDAFLLGSALALVEPALRKDTSKVTIAIAIGPLALAFYCLVYLAVNGASGADGIDRYRNIVSGVLYGQHRELFLYSAVSLAAASALLSAVTGHFGRWLSHPFPAFVGRISYGGYLFHALVLSLLLPVFEVDGMVPVALRPALLVMCWGLTITLAWLSYRSMEAPLIAWARTRRT